MRGAKLYADLCVKPSTPKEALRMAQLMDSMGYGLVAIDSSSRDLAEVIRAFKEFKIEPLKRTTVKARSTSEMLRKLREAARHADVVAVEPEGPEAVRAAARDSRVNLVIMPPYMARYMDRSQALLLRQGGGAIELQLSYLRRPDANVLRGFMIVARRACAYEAPLVVSSCAETCWDLWHPYSVRGLLVSLGVPEHVAKLALTAYPRAAVGRS